MLWFGVVRWAYWKTRKLKLMQFLFLSGRQHDNFCMNNEQQHLTTNSLVAWSTLICHPYCQMYSLFTYKYLINFYVRRM